MEERSRLASPFRLGDWEVHPEDGTLRSAAEVRRLEPQLMDLLVFLAGRAGEVVAKQQLFAGVWDGRIVSDDALTGAVSQIRKALGDEARTPRFIETIPKRGYRLLVSPAAPEVEAGAAAARAARPEPALAAGPRRRGWRRLGAGVAMGVLLAAAILLAFVRRPAGDGRREGASPAQEAARSGLALLDNPSQEGLEQARLDFVQALELDPQLAEAEAGLAHVYLLQVFAGVGSPAELFPRARAAALRAVALDPELAESRLAFGAVLFLGDRDFRRAEEELRRAIRLQPDAARGHYLLALFLSASGRRGEAVAEALRAVELAPANLTIRSSAMETLFMARRYEAVLQMGETTLALAPDFPQTYFQMGWAYAFLGRDREAYDAFRMGCRNSGIPEESLERLDQVFAAEGLPGVFRSAARAMERAGAVARVHWGDLVAFYAGGGEKDRAFALLESAVERGEPGLVWMRVSPFADGMRSDPRFERLVRRLGLPPVPPG